MTNPDMHAPTVQAVLESPLWRHAITLGMAAIALGTIWGTTKADVDKLKIDQTDTERTIQVIRETLGQARVDAAIAKQKLIDIERRIDSLDSKINTLIWRTSPTNPKSPYPAAPAE